VTTTLYKDVREAGTKTEIETDEDGDRTTYYYVTLKTPAGEREAWSASSESEAQELARRVQSFVNGTESQLLVDSDKFDLGDLVIVILLSLIFPLLIAISFDRGFYADIGFVAPPRDFGQLPVPNPGGVPHSFWIARAENLFLPRCAAGHGSGQDRF
jgi:hypothetical protein